MKLFVCAVFLSLVFLELSMAKESSPKVQVYSRLPGEIGKQNVLICHVTGFYPPEIEIEVLRNNQAIPHAKQTDLAFEEDWHYHLTKHATFTPNKDETYSCRVTHLGKPRIYTWESDV
ncbi:beta-2-microglobulin-like [Anabas testudineus]|uniref:Beta-2-microglobulin n=1 Tax=Anabas testudineus TaxID=64144 RepID=A0A3Q1GYT0_ANATE|nr:beta-2-microglobulin-like [Anabas testudineus]XP_026219981.1 beta-2-microglobulin-like [Anabas testudineus]